MLPHVVEHDKGGVDVLHVAVGVAEEAVGDLDEAGVAAGQHPVWVGVPEAGKRK